MQILVSISDPPTLPSDLNAIWSDVIKISVAPDCQTEFLKVTDISLNMFCWKTGQKTPVYSKMYIFGAILAYFPMFGVNYSQKF